MKYCLLLSLLITMPCLGQATPGEAETKGPCSPAVAGSKNTVVINCRIGADQGRALSKIMNQILADQTDLSEISAKLDQCLQGIPQVRHLTEQQKDTLQSAVAAFPDGLIVVYYNQDPKLRDYDYAREFISAFGSKAVQTNAVQMETVRGVQVGATYNDTVTAYVQYARQLARQ